MKTLDLRSYQASHPGSDSEKGDQSSAKLVTVQDRDEGLVPALVHHTLNFFQNPRVFLATDVGDLFHGDERREVALDVAQ